MFLDNLMVKLLQPYKSVTNEMLFFVQKPGSRSDKDQVWQRPRYPPNPYDGVFVSIFWGNWAHFLYTFDVLAVKVFLMATYI